MVDEDKERRRLLGVCRSLKPAEAMVLQLLSVVYAPVAPAELAQAAHRYNAGLSALGDVLAALAAKGVMESTPDGLVCHPLIREPLTQADKRAFLDTKTGVALGSDAFFPFSDSIERGKLSGVSYVAEPGGSIRDDAVIEACDKYNMVMAFTGMRLFHH